MQGKIDGAFIRATSRFVSTEKTRPYLHGVHVQAHNGGVLLSASDGHSALVAFDAGGRWPYAPAILQFDKPVLAAMRQGVNTDFPHAPEAGKRAPCLVADRTFDACCLDQQFPDLLRLIPRTASGNQVYCFNPALLARFGEAQRDLTGQRVQCVSLTADNATSPILVGMGSAPAIGVCMPMRGDEPQFPAWLARDAAKRSAA